MLNEKLGKSILGMDSIPKITQSFLNCGYIIAKKCKRGA